jgi:Holliday junction DNA helicase RuvA
MIGSLEGKLLRKTPDYILIDVHGVGYLVHVPLSTFYDLPDIGQAVSLNIHTHVREDVIQLFGFRKLEEKEIFLHLITVNGVGPRLAMGILSGIGAEELRQAVLRQDPHRFKKIPGVGQKIAQRLVLELHDRLKLKKDSEVESTLPATEGDSYSDAFSALLNLGYKPAEAERAMKKVQQQLGDGLPVERLLKEALRTLV